MRRFLTTIAAIAAVVCAIATAAPAVQWQLYSETKYGEKYYIDTESTGTSRDLVTISIKSEAATAEAVRTRVANLQMQKASTVGSEDYAYRIQQCEINCSKAEWRPLSFSDYNSKSAVIGTDAKPAKSVAITKDTIIDFYYKKLCIK